MDILGELQKEKNKRQVSKSKDILGTLQRQKNESVPSKTTRSGSGYTPVADLNRATNGAGVSSASGILEQAARDVAATLPEARTPRTTRTYWDGTTRERQDRGAMLRGAIGTRYDTEGSIASGVQRGLGTATGAGAAAVDALSGLDYLSSNDRKRIENAQKNLETYTANRDAATNEAERQHWQKLADHAQNEIEAYTKGSEAKRQNATDAAEALRNTQEGLFREASEGDYAARAGRALETVEKYGDNTYDDNLAGLIGSNYGVGRLSQNSSYAWNEYLNDPTPENRAIAELYDLALSNTGENNADALTPDNELETWARSIANYAPQFLDQTAARLKGGAAGLLLGSVGAGQAAGSALDMYAIMRGAAFRGLLETGVPEEQAIKMAKDEALISSIIEYADSLAEYAFMGGKDIVKLLMSGGAELATTTAGKSAGRAAAKIIAAYLGNIVQEGEEERSQEAVSIANERRLAGGTTDSGKLGLAQNALDVYWNEGLRGDRESETYQRMAGAAEEGRRVATVFAAIPAGTGYAANRAVNRMSTSRGMDFVSDALDQAERGEVSDLAANRVLNNSFSRDLMQREGGVTLTDDMTKQEQRDAIKQAAARLAGVSEAEPVAVSATNNRTEISEPSTPQRMGESEAREALPLRGVSEQQLDRDLADAARLSVTLGRSGANAFLTAYDRATAASVEPTEAFENFSKVYNAAVRGENAPEVSMPEHLRIAAQGAGENDARTAAQAQYFGENAGLAPNRSGRPRNLSRREARVLDAIGKAAGVQIRFADTMNGANASIENGVLTIAKDADDPVRAAFTHEIVHRVRESAPEAYSTLAQFVVDNMSDERLASAIRARSDAYSDMNYSISDITEETVADAFGRMASEPELLEKIAGVDRTAAQKVLDAIDELLRKIKAALSGKEQAQLTANQIEAFRDLQGRGEEMAKALRAALDKVQEQTQTANESAATELPKSNTQNGGVRKSLKENVVYNKTALLSESTVDRFLEDYAAKSTPNYAQAYIAWLSPEDFINLTTSREGRFVVDNTTKPLDINKLVDATQYQPFQLRIDHETGEISGHEGRHRANALLRAGVEHIPVLMFDSSNKYDKETISELLLKGQDFGSNRSYAEVLAFDLMPLSYANRDRVVKEFGTPPSMERMATQYNGTQSVRFSRNVDSEYMAAVERGDMDEAERMVDEAAKAAGYTVKGWHQTAGDFTVFNTNNPSAALNDSETPNGIFFKTNDHDIGLDGKKQMPMYLNLGRTLSFKNREEANAWYRKNIDGYDDRSKQFENALKPIEEEMNRIETEMFKQDTTDEEYDRLDTEWNKLLEKMHTVEDGYRAQLRELLNDYFLDGDSGYNSIHLGYDGHRYVDGKRENVETYIVFSNKQAKFAEPVVYDNDGNVIPLSQRFNSKNNDIRYSRNVDSDGRELTEAQQSVGINYDAPSESANAVRFSRRTWEASDYAKDKKKAAQDLSKALGCSVRTATKFINDVNSIAKMIADDRTRLDYEAAPGASSFVSNVEYGGSIDFSTICKKRRLLTGTIEAIQKAMPNGVLTADEVLKIRETMKKRGYEVSCGLCYVEGSRAKMGEFAAEFINLYKKYHPDAKWMPNMYDVNTPTGAENMRVNHPDVYKEYEHFWNHYGTLREGDPNLFASQQKPKLFQAATEYDGEILKKFRNDGTVAEKNKNGGLRLQSFSDFEIIHLIDTMQVIMDMSRVGLAGQAYTKVPDFAWAVGGTGLKVNCSLIAKGVDENGRIILDEVEGMKRADAEALRNAYSKNVGTILVVFNDEQLQAAMNDPFIDFIIPFHRSQWAKRQYEILGLPANVKDYTNYQNEKLLQSGKKGNLMPNEYWDFKKSGKANAKRYLELCAENGKRPKFYNLLVNNGDGSYSLQPDGSTDGYWKLLIDFKMYDNQGKGSPQMPVQPKFNMEQAERMLNEYTGGHEQFPVAQDVVDEFVQEKSEGRRFSRKSVADAEAREAALLQENDLLREEIKYWKAQLERTPKENVGIVEPEAVKKAARDLISTYGSTIKTEEITEGLQNLYNLMGTGGDENGELSYEAAREIANGIAREIAESALNDTESAYRMYEDLRKFLRTTKITITPAEAKEISDYGDWRKHNMGRIDIARGESSNIDRVYDELSDRWPEYFPGDVISVGDQLQRIADVMDYIYRDRGHNPFDPYMDQAVIDIGNDIMDRFFDLPQAKTFADKQAAKLGGMRIKMSELRQRNEERLRESMAKARADRDAKLREMKDHYAEIAQRRRERRENTEARNKLLHIARRLANKKLPAVNRALLNEYIGDLDLVAKSMTGATLEKLTDLRDWYFDQRDNNPDFIADPHIEKLIERLSKRQIKDLTDEEVRDLTDVLLNIENEIRTQNKLINSKDRHDTYMAGMRAIQDIENSRGIRENAAGTLDKLLINNTLSPVREMHRLTAYADDDPLYVLINELADGQRKQFDYQRRAGERFLKWTEDKKLVERIRGKKAEEIRITGIGKNGPTEVTITPAMRMSLYLHSKNAQNLRHITGGGIRVPDMQLYKRGKLSEAYDRGTTIKLTPSQIQSIVNQMTAEERAFADAASAYFNGMSREAINETSEKLKGYSLAGVENYFPIDTDKSFVKKDFDSLKFDGTLEGMGFLKERINSASPIMLYDMDNVLRRSIEQHAKYYGLAVPVRNFNKVWGVTKASFDEDGNRNGYESSVMQAMREKWGDAGYNYVDKLMSDLQSGHSEQNDFDKLMRKVRSNYAGAVLTLNASVAMKQAASYPTAAAVVGWKPLARALGNIGKVDLNTVNKYTPLLWYRTQGFSTQELGDMARQDKQLPKLLNWVQGMDVLTTRKLWKAAEYYVQGNQDVQRGSEEYYKAVADVYNRIIEETQPNYTTMQRPQILRSNSTLLQSLSMFKTQPFQNFNVLYDALGNFEAKKKAARIDGSAEAQSAYKDAKKRAGWAITSQLAQLAVFAGMTAAWNLFRGKTDNYDDDDEKVTAESVLKRIMHDMLGGAASMVPFGSDVWEFASSIFGNEKYYGFDEVTSSSINDLLKAFSKAGASLGKTWESVSKGEPVNWNAQRLQWDSVVKAVSKTAGVPFENVENLFNAIYRMSAIAAAGKYKGTYAYLRLTKDPSDTGAYYDNLYGAYKNDKTAYEEIYADMTANGFDAGKIKTAMEKRMKKSEGVESVKDLGERYLAPEAQTVYDETLGRMQRSSVWRGASAEQREKAEGLLYDLLAGSSAGDKLREKINGGAGYGLDSAEYILYRLALSMTDEPTESGKYGTYTNAEVEAAIRMVPNLTNVERDYLWTAQGKNAKSAPKW